MKHILFYSIIAFLPALIACAQSKYESDEFSTSVGKLKITFIGHASLIFELEGKHIYIDPCGEYANYTGMTKADVIFITHHHFDHVDTASVDAIVKNGTRIILTKDAYDMIGQGTIMANGDTLTVDGIGVEAVPAYNTTAGRDKFHPKGRDNGYILTIGDKRIYIAGDTEDIPEMALIKNIDIAFLPMNQPYTMLPKQVAAVAEIIKPKILYPYHYGETDVKLLEDLMTDRKDVEVRIRSLK